MTSATLTFDQDLWRPGYNPWLIAVGDRPRNHHAQAHHQEENNELARVHKLPRTWKRSPVFRVENRSLLFRGGSLLSVLVDTQPPHLRFQCLARYPEFRG